MASTGKYNYIIHLFDRQMVDTVPHEGEFYRCHTDSAAEALAQATEYYEDKGDYVVIGIFKEV